MIRFYTNAQGLGEPEVGRTEEHNGRGLYSCSRLKATCKNRQSRGFNIFTDKSCLKNCRPNLNQVVEILSQVLADLVQGEFQQLQTKQDEEDRC